jgi:outer membrane protein OmpA-like peptidoglycan-associated protein
MGALLAALGGCGGPKQEIALQMTRETVVQPPVIRSLILEPPGRIDTRAHGQSVRVTLTGDPGLEATFDVAGRFTGRPMIEAEPGVYTGAFEVEQGATGELVVIGHLVHPPSGAHQETRSSPVTLWLAPPPAESADACTPAMRQALGALLEPLAVHFAFDGAVLSDEARTALQGARDALAAHPHCTIYVAGHADDVGDDNYNYVLSVRRALAVSQFLESLGVPHERLEKHYLGENRPLARGEDEAARGQNRRVELLADYPY